MKRIVLLLLLALFYVPVFAQDGYYKADSTAEYGVKIKNGGEIENAKLIEVGKGKEIIQLSPNDIREYGFSKSQVYISKPILVDDSIQRVFLERLVKGNSTLYYYRNKNYKTFFLEKDSIHFSELPKEKNGEDDYFRDELKSYTSDCAPLAEANEFVRYSKRSLSLFIRRYNNCENKPFPHLRFGVIGGLEFTRQSIPSMVISSYSNLGNVYEGSIMAGAFIDQPVLISNFSLHAEITYSSHSFSDNEKSAENEMDLLSNVSALKIPVLIRYTYPSNRFKPYINGGSTLAYNFKHETKIWEFTGMNEIINVNKKFDNSLHAVIGVGYSVGCGVEYAFNSKNSLFIEARFNRINGKGNLKSFDNSDLQFFTGFNF